MRFFFRVLKVLKNVQKQLYCAESSGIAASTVIIPLSGERGRRVKAASAEKCYGGGHNYRRPLMKAITLFMAPALTLRGRRANVALL